MEAKVTACTGCGAMNGVVKGSSLCFNCYVKQKDASSGVKERRNVRHEEDDMQKEFFTDVRQLFPYLGRLIFAIPNGGKRDSREAARMKSQGVTPGVSDIICLVPRGGYNCLCLEAKTNEGVQSSFQKEFQKQIEEAGGRYEIFRSVSEGIEILQTYLKS